ncbi:hypothetical protein [Sphingomonas oleivorans]|uniref:hypothetical protein n=1 Tax=Sphingomonas oleivorans TaxID=1735121 RepID=UPI0013FDDEA8|nr:hypothetical protein [Sphingomonas oleivorans]
MVSLNVRWPGSMISAFPDMALGTYVVKQLDLAKPSHYRKCEAELSSRTIVYDFRKKV